MQVHVVHFDSPGSLSRAFDRILASGDTIQLGRSADFQSLAADLGDETSVILERIEDVLSERTVSDIRESSNAFAAAMRELQDLVRAERESLSSLLANLDQASGRPPCWL